MRKEYETQLAYRQHLQAFIDRWRYNANRGIHPLFDNMTNSDNLSASQAQMKIKILEKVIFYSIPSFLHRHEIPFSCLS